MRAALGALLAALAAGCAQLVPAPSAEPAGDPHAAWARVLERFVDGEGRVDFAALARDRADLDTHVAWVYRSGPRHLAEHINAYNALAMYNVLDSGIPRSLDGPALTEFFFLRKLTVGGVAMSLYAYEKDVIRPLGEERVHFALNCMVRGCPRLPRAPFTAQALERQLADETRRFLNEPRNVRVDAASRTIHLSELLRFYPEDFLARAPSLVEYVNRHRADKLPADYAVRFIPYDWTVNAR
ncbi:MAG: DUF547 domain-containing protein [Betaproteobacteria bacterium]